MLHQFLTVISLLACLAVTKTCDNIISLTDTAEPASENTGTQAADGENVTPPAAETDGDGTAGTEKHTAYELPATRKGEMIVSQIGRAHV